MNKCSNGSTIAAYVVAGLLVGTAAGVAMQCLRGRKPSVKRSIGAMMCALGEALENASEYMK